MISLIFLFGIGNSLDCGDATPLTPWCTKQNGTIQTGVNSTNCASSDRLIIGVSVAFCGRNNTDLIDLDNLEYLDFRSDPEAKCPYAEGIGDLYGAQMLDTM